MIELNQVTVYLQKRTILTDVSMTVHSENHLCILGPNGSGKTTLLKTIAGLLSYQGSVKIDGQEVKQLKRKQMAQKVALLSQFTTIAFDYTVYETVLMGCYHYQKTFFPRVSPEVHQHVLDCLKRTSLLDLKDKVVNQLSGGQQQRVFLAKVFAQDPEILLLDEPNNHLDIRYQKTLIQELKQWGQQEKKTLIGVFHDIRLALMLSQNILLLKEGKIVAQGAFSTIASRKLLAETFDLDIVDYFQQQQQFWIDIK
uniref:ABC transporter ATP-binding protein n=1 Tax=Candidatus Enterococcus willemsii TaxID=1857215 RepID=UPI00403F37F5